MERLERLKYEYFVNSEKKDIEINLIELAKQLYIHQDFEREVSFRAALKFFEYQQEFMNDADTIGRIEALAQKKAALVTTPEQQENDNEKVSESNNNQQI